MLIIYPFDLLFEEGIYYTQLFSLGPLNFGTPYFCLSRNLPIRVIPYKGNRSPQGNSLSLDNANSYYALVPEVSTELVGTSFHCSLL